MPSQAYSRTLPACSRIRLPLNTWFNSVMLTRLQEDYQNAEQARSHLLGLRISARRRSICADSATVPCRSTS
eukprot:6235584-Amphidinium_carterae.2